MERHDIGHGDRRIRAANFFALHAIWKKPQLVNSIWDDLNSRIDLSRPLASDALVALGRFDIDLAMLQRQYAAALESLSQLRSNDRILEWHTDDYPARLGKVQSAPRFLFVRSQEPLLDMPSLAIVGTRNPSEDGRRRARKLGYLLAKRGIAVVSGLARGIDTAAHEGALEIGGQTIAVLGTPLTRCYPKENKQLQAHIGQVGALVSQFHPGAITTPFAFPLRNATMSGLTLGTVIIEATQTSGALIQAQHCLAQGRKLFIPRSAIENVEIRWPRTYRERGAQVFSTIDELLEILEHESLFMQAPGSLPAAEVTPLNVARG